MIKIVGVVGAGTMGHGIAQVFAQAGFAVQLVDVAQPMLDRARSAIEKSLGKFVEKGKLTADDRDASARPPVHDDTARATGCCRLRRRSHRRGRRRQAGALRESRRDLCAARDSRVEHLVDLDHGARRGDEAARAGARHALHEPRAADDARRADSRTGDVRRRRCASRPTCAWRSARPASRRPTIPASSRTGS